MISWLTQPSEEVAPRLLGCLLERTLEGKTVLLKIVETEAYAETDEASHSFKGKTNRTSIMFGEAGHLYVYFTYGMHYCCNVVTGRNGEGSAVLIRALEPLSGEELLDQYRPVGGVQRTNGPAKLCQALNITAELNGHSLAEPPLRLIEQPPLHHDEIIRTSRIGISKAKDAPLRFYIKAHPYVSKL